MAVAPRFEGIPVQPVDLDGPLVWLLVAFGAFIVGTLAWVALRSVLQRRRVAMRVRCPVHGRHVMVLVARTSDGHRRRVVSCSLRDRRLAVRCADACLPAAAATGAR